MKKNQTGRSMVEMLGVLAIIGVLSIGGIAGYSMAMEKYRINKTIENIVMLVQETRATFISQENFKGLDWYDSRKSSNEDSPAKTIFENAVGNPPYPMAIHEMSDGGFIVSVYEISSTVCVALGTKDWSVLGGNYEGASVGLAPPGMPNSISDVKGICSSGIPGLTLSFDGDGLLIKGDIDHTPG